MSVQQEATTTRTAGPRERLPHPARRAAEHPWATHHHRLIAGVLLVNAAVAVVQLRSGAWRVDDGSVLEAASDLVLLDLVAAVLVRSEHVTNALFWLVCRAPRWLPAGVRWAVSKVHHLGGIHVGGSLAGTVWLVVSTALATGTGGYPDAGAPTTTLVLAWSLVALPVPGLQGAEDVLVEVEGGQDQHPRDAGGVRRPRTGRHQRRGGRQPVHARHPHVHEDHVRANGASTPSARAAAPPTT